MKTFKQHLNEVVRDEKRATKLGLYLAKRHSGSNNIFFKNYDDHKAKIADHAYGKGYKNSRSKGSNINADFDKSETKKIPLNKLHVTQDYTEFSKKGARWKMKDKDAVHVIKHGKDHFLINGHHRYIAHKLLGKKHIDAKIIHVKE